jgi:hypothetical protein
MTVDDWTDADTQKARQFWAEYQRQHDVSDQIGQTAGIDPASGRIWFGASARDIVAQMDAAGVATPLYFVRIGFDHYLRKGRNRCLLGP